ncbi:MAG: PorT family protein [Crocinitomicaceae bacterium]|nr:PorT family protein [Crocinitomicaceae bacterium]
MKKIVLGLMILSISSVLNAQSAAEKKFQGGLTAGFGINFQNMGTKLIEKDGVGTDLFIGGALNFGFTDNIGFSTGLEFAFSNTKFKSGPSPILYYYNDSKIIGVDDFDKDPASVKDVFVLKERKQKATYITIPTMLLFRTNFIGYVRYYGKFGMKHNFLLTQKSDDKGYSLTAQTQDLSKLGEEVEQKNMKAKNEVVFYKGSVGIAGGAEWNFTGNTCLLAEIGYYYGITPLYYNRNNSYMFTYETDNATVVRKGVSNKATQGQFEVKVSVLF